MFPRDFVDASTLFQSFKATMTQEEQAEYRYYSFLGSISRAVVDYRIKHSLSQTQLAQQLSISQAMVSKYESGDYNISLKALNDLCLKLGMDLDIRLSSHTANSIVTVESATFDFSPESQATQASSSMSIREQSSVSVDVLHDQELSFAA